MWQTDEVRQRRLSVLDEAQNILFYFGETLFQVTPRLYEDLQTALAECYPGDDIRHSPAFWNTARGSAATGTATRRSPWRTRRKCCGCTARQALALFIPAVRTLSDRLSQSRHYVGVSDDLEQSLLADAERLPAVAAEAAGRSPTEPYRRKCEFIWERLRRTQSGGEGGYGSASEFVADLELIQQFLEAEQRAISPRGAPWRRCCCQARLFGFHLARLDIREHKDKYLGALAAVLRDRREPIGTALTEPEKVALLEREIGGVRPLIPARLDFDEETNKTLGLFRLVSDKMETLGPDAFGSFILSMASDVSDVLAVLLLAKEARLADLREEDGWSQVDVVPLFETIEDLENAPQILDTLLSNPALPAQCDPARRGAGSHGRLFGQQQRRRLSDRQLEAVCRPGAAGRSRPAARRYPAPVSRARRRGRTRRRACRESDPGPAARQRPGAAQNHRAGRSHRRPLF